MTQRLDTCAACGASNPAGSDWCGQCYEPLEGPQQDHSLDAAEQLSAANVAIDTGQTTVLDEKVDLDGAPWVCHVCETPNPLTATACSVCQTTIFDSHTPPKETPEVADVLRASAIPGGGLFAVGRQGEGAMVALLVLFCIVGGVAVIIAGKPAAMLLILAGLAIWAVAARDAAAIVTSGQDEAWLRPRVISIIAAAVLFMAAVLVFQELPTGGGS